MICPPTVMSVPLVLRNFDPRAERPGGFFSSLGLGLQHASAHLGALGWVGALGTWLEGSSFFACGGLGHHHLFTVHHGNLQLGVKTKTISLTLLGTQQQTQEALGHHENALVLGCSGYTAGHVLYQYCGRGQQLEARSPRR